MKIRSIGENPYRANSGRAQRFALYKIGMTKQEYIDAGGNANAWDRDYASGVIQLEGEPDREPVRKTREAKSRAPREPRTAPAKAPVAEPRDPNLRYAYDDEERVPITAVSHSEKKGPIQDRYWIFAEGADGSRWKLKQEIHAFGEMEGLKNGAMELKWIQPKWWEILRGGTPVSTDAEGDVAPSPNPTETDPPSTDQE